MWQVTPIQERDDESYASELTSSESIPGGIINQVSMQRAAPRRSLGQKIFFRIWKHPRRKSLDEPGRGTCREGRRLWNRGLFVTSDATMVQAFDGEMTVREKSRVGRDHDGEVLRGFSRHQYEFSAWLSLVRN